MVPRRAVLLALLQLVERDLLALLLGQLHHLALATELHLLMGHVAGRARVPELQALDFSRQRLVQRCSFS
jgi:hypothetical protein